jgi:hypothetical protein
LLVRKLRFSIRAKYRRVSRLAMSSALWGGKLSVGGSIPGWGRFVKCVLDAAAILNAPTTTDEDHPAVKMAVAIPPV